MNAGDGKDPPIDGAYWVRPGTLLAGPYPGDRFGIRTRRRLRRRLRAGVTFFLDLTEAGEYGVQPYVAFLQKEAAVIEHSIRHKHPIEHKRPIAYRRAPIPDRGTPTVDEMARILDAIDAELEAGHTVYLHCLGGIGRTGTVVGCYLARHGMSGKDAMAQIARLRQGVPGGWEHSLETMEQVEMVLAYSGETLHRWPGGPVKGGDAVRVLIVPTEQERRAVREALPAAVPWTPWEGPAWRAGDLLVIESGMGLAATAAVLPRLDALAPEAVWLFGWCGGLAADLAVGDLALADATVLRAGDGAVTRIAHPPPEALVAQVRRVAQALGVRLAVGPVLTSDRVLATVADKRAGAGTGAVAVEMEAGPLARWAAARGTPFVHLRVVLDPLQSALPTERLHGDEEGEGGKWAFFVGALLHPREWRAVWRLVGQVRLARRAMTRTIAGLARPGGPLAAAEPPVAVSGSC